MNRVTIWSTAVSLMIGTTVGYAAHPSYETIATGLNNPRGIAFAPDGSLYITEAGFGGTGPCLASVERPACYGPSGSITRVQNGVQSKYLENLPSLAGPDGSEASGPGSISITANGEIYVLVELGTNPADRSDPSALNNVTDRLGYLLHLPVDSSDHRFADISGYESAQNPDGGEIDSNPHAFTLDGDRFIVVDSGGNSLLEVDPQGAISTLAVFPAIEVPKPPFLPQDPPTMPMDAVPDSVAIGPDGAYYVGQLTGFPFPLGQAQVFRVVPGEQPTVYASGFTNIIGLSFDSNGMLYVLEIRKNSLLSEDTTGALYRVASDGTKTLLMDEGLESPTALAFDANGLLYICNQGVTVGEGKVIRLNPNNLPVSAIDSEIWNRY